jgi:hypothetical protein
MTSRPIASYQTPRKCTVCQKPATVWVKTAKDIYGAPDKSSIQPRCAEHEETR